MQTTPINTPPSIKPISQNKQKPLKNKMSSLLLGGALLLLLLIGGATGLYLTQINQDVRQQASEDIYCVDGFHYIDGRCLVDACRKKSSGNIVCGYVTGEDYCTTDSLGGDYCIDQSRQSVSCGELGLMRCQCSPGSDTGWWVIGSAGSCSELCIEAGIDCTDCETEKPPSGGGCFDPCSDRSDCKNSTFQCLYKKGQKSCWKSTCDPESPTPTPTPTPSVPTITPTPTPELCPDQDPNPPEGCYYENISCTQQGLCDCPILVCYTPTPTPPIGPQCHSIEIYDPNAGSPIVLSGEDDNNFVPGETTVNFICSANIALPNGYHYRFKIWEPADDDTPAPPFVLFSNSWGISYDITKSGDYAVQCAVCEDGEGDESCDWEAYTQT